MPTIVDIHTHTPGRQGAVLSAAPELIEELPAEQLYSLSLHPWYVTPTQIELFTAACAAHVADPRWVAVGECGLDALCRTPGAWQQEAFATSLKVARDVLKPTVVHCVRRWDEVLRLVREVWGAEGARMALRAGAPIVLHGFRKGKVLAQQLLAQGFCFSLGEHSSEEVARLIPTDRLYFETDESQRPIEEIKKRIIGFRDARSDEASDKI
jgi:TatD DNase family protein